MTTPAESESSAKESGDDPGWLQRFWRPQSAFTVGDLASVARAGDPHTRLEHIYEWYFTRTMNAIRVASVAAGGVAAAIYGLALKRPPCTACEGLLSSGLTAAAVVCVIAGIAQRRELAQLHTELARAHGLLTDLCGVSKERLGDVTQASGGAAQESEADGWRLAVGALVLLAAIAFAVGWGKQPLHALEALAVLVALLGSLHVLAEVWRHRPDRREEGGAGKPANDTSRTSVEPCAGAVPEAAEPGLMAVVDARLDDYVMLPSVRRKVRAAIQHDLKHHRRPPSV